MLLSVFTQSEPRREVTGVQATPGVPPMPAVDDSTVKCLRDGRDSCRLAASQRNVETSHQEKLAAKYIELEFGPLGEALPTKN